MNLEPYIEFARELALRSGDFIRPYFGDLSVEVESKADASPVTVADRGAEALMRDLIGQRYPDHGIIGEEYGTHNADADWVWVLDPIDGTKSFAAAVPLFGTLIALQHQGQPVLGVIHQPILGQLCIGTGAGTQLNGVAVHLREPSTLAEALLLTTDILAVERYHAVAGWNDLTHEVRLVRTWGDCYGYLLLASGWADIMCDPKMEIWDLAALEPIVRGAGGVLTGWNGGPAHNSAVAAHPRLHAQVIEVLNR
jgi:myo-inositol-1(or 4)-monophosphatase